TSTNPYLDILADGRFTVVFQKRSEEFQSLCRAESLFEDVKRFVTPLSYRLGLGMSCMKKAKQDSEATESTGVGQDDVGSQCPGWAFRASRQAHFPCAEETSQQNEASRRRGTEANVKMVNRGAYTVAVPVRLPARSQSPSRSAHQTPDRPCAVAVATASATPVCSVPLGLGRCSSCEPPKLRRVTVTQSCSAPSLFPQPPLPTAESQSLAQLVIQQLNGPARQEQRCSVVPQHAIPRQLQSSTAVPAEHAAKAAANTQQTQQVHLKDFKPLLRQLFEEESSQTQSAEQLQSKIDQLQALQQILQVQQRGLKQQQQALQRPPAARTACMVRSTPRTSVAKGRSGSEARRRFLL
ncbi:sodA, partial [Symbiodinium necroappetens]